MESRRIKRCKVPSSPIFGTEDAGKTFGQCKCKSAASKGIMLASLYSSVSKSFFIAQDVLHESSTCPSTGARVRTSAGTSSSTTTTTHELRCPG
jgi:hypothetical protein